MTVVPVGGGAVVTIPSNDIEWKIRHKDLVSKVRQEQCLMPAASILESYEYLIMRCEPKEQIRRLKLMKKAMKQAKERDTE